MKQPRTVNEVIDALGGYLGVADFIGSGETNSFHWKSKGVIPPKFFDEFEKKLGPLPRHLFDWWRP